MDPDAKTLTYHLVSGAGDGNNSFFTMETNGTLKAAVTFDYESNASSYSIRVQAKDEHNATVEEIFLVTITDDSADNFDYRGQDISSMDLSGQDLSTAQFDSTTVFSDGTQGVNLSHTAMRGYWYVIVGELMGEFYGFDLSAAQFDNTAVYSTARKVNLSGTNAVLLGSDAAMWIFGERTCLVYPS